MKHIKKYIAFLLLAVFIPAITACDFDNGGGGNTAQITGAVDLTVPYKGTDFDFLYGVSAGNSVVTVDSSAVDFNKLGVYEITYSITGTSITKKVNVEVVLGTQKSIADNDIALFAQLMGREPSGAEKGLINAVAAIRAENYTSLIIPLADFGEYGTDEELIQDIFFKELSDIEISLIMLYYEMWDYNSDIPNSELKQIKYSLLLGRSLSAAEMQAIDDLIDIIDLYEYGEHKDFLAPTRLAIEAFLERELTEEETAAYNSLLTIKFDFTGKMYLVMMSINADMELDTNQINAIMLLSDIFAELPLGPVPTLQDIQEMKGITFNAEQIAAYNIILEIDYERLFKIYSEYIEDSWGREISDSEKIHVMNCIIMMNEVDYNIEHFMRLTQSEIETELKRQLTDSEVESLYYVKTQTTIFYIEGAEVTLTNEEKEAVPAVLKLQDEYKDNQEESDPDFDETETDEDIEEVLDRVLTEDEKAALVHFRAVISRMILN